MFSVGKKRCLRIRLKSGKMIEASEGTKFWDGSNWVKADHLKIGDKIATDATQAGVNRKGIFYDEVMSIEEVGEIEMFDFEIPGTNCYFANGILVHNSGDLEQDADVVIGVYREDKDSEEMEIAGLKGRDVGTWKDKLRFDRYIQKLYDI